MGTAYGEGITTMRNTQWDKENYGLSGGTMKCSIDYIAAVAAEVANGDVLMLAKVPSWGVPISIKVWNDEIDSNSSPTLTGEVGLYNGPEPYYIGTTKTDAEAVIDIDCFCDEGELTAAILGANNKGTEVFDLQTNTLLTADKLDQQFWQWGGLSEDPRSDLYVAITFNAANATAADGDVGMVVKYLVP